MGHGVDWGTARSGARIGGAGGRGSRSSVGRRRFAGAALAVLPVVVTLLNRDQVRVSVVIPTHNEAQSIGRVLAELPADIVTEVLVVDSNSTDGTPEIASKMGARVLQEPRRGYGQACLTGLASASTPDVVVFLDGDYSDRPAELPLLLAPIIDGRADITLGSLLGKKSIRGALPCTARFGNRR